MCCVIAKIAGKELVALLDIHCISKKMRSKSIHLKQVAIRSTMKMGCKKDTSVLTVALLCFGSGIASQIGLVLQEAVLPMLFQNRQLALVTIKSLVG